MKAIGISALSTQVLIDDAKFQKHMKILECTDSVSAVLVNPHDKTFSFTIGNLTPTPWTLR